METTKTIQTIQTLDAPGVLIARTPLAVSPPGAAWGDADDVQRLASMGYGQSAIRYIPASTLRHVIRYGIARVVQAALAQHGRSLTLHQLLALDKGFVQMKKNQAKNGKGKKKPAEAVQEAGKEAEVDAKQEPEAKAKKKKTHEILQDELDTRERNPLLGLLGMWGVPSELRVRNVIPQHAEIGGTYGKASGLTRKGLEDDLMSMLPSSDQQAYCDLLDAGAEKEKDVTGLKHFSDKTWEEITQGASCDWGYMIHRTTPMKSGAVLAALRAFAADPVIGAHQAVGRGEVEIHLTPRVILQDILNGPTVTEMGTVHVARGIFEITGAIADDLRAFDEAARAGFPEMDFGVIPDLAGDAN